jgi:hypothetical protein
MQRSHILRASGRKIEFVGAVSTSGSSSLSLTGITDLKPGDVVVAFSQDDNDTHTLTSSGWSGWNSNFPGSNGNQLIQNIAAYKTMGATPDTSIQVNQPVDVICAAAFRNAQWASSTSSAGGGNISSITAPSLTINKNDSAAIYFAMLDDDNSTITGVPTGYTIATQNASVRGTGGIIYRLERPAGTESPSGSITFSSADSIFVRGLVLQP